MKKVLFLSVFLTIIFSNSLSAQTGINIGFKAGYSLGTQYGIKPPNIPYEVNSFAKSGFTGGIILLFPITDAFSVQQEFIYTTKGSGQDITMTEPPLSTSTKYTLNYFELPILFRYTFVNIGNVGIYGSSGFALSTLINGKYSVEGVIDMGEVIIPIDESGNTDGLDKFDYSFIYGLGLNFNLFNKDCFFDYRQTIGSNTLMMPTIEGGDPAPLRNQTYSFTLGLYL